MTNEAPAVASRTEAPAAQARVAIAGATGYAGQELVRILARHPGVRLEAAMSSGADREPRPMPALARIWDGAAEPLDIERLASLDIVFLALPDTASAELAPALLARGVRVIDLSGAFRLRDDAARAHWYPAAAAPLPDGTAYGLTERRADEVRSARLVSNPGCYPTAALLALEPLRAAGLIEETVVIDAKSGVSGAGKQPSDRTHFCEVDDSLSTYGVFAHRHGAEISQGAGPGVTFVPHLIPIVRGILESIYVQVRPGVTATTIGDAYTGAYGQATFVRLTGDTLPEIKHVTHTNFCDIGWKVDSSSNRALVVSVIDNLVKGAAGQAVQNMNLLLGLDERTGLL